MAEFDIAFDVFLDPHEFDLNSDKLVESISSAAEIAQLGEVHAGGEASTGLLNVSFLITALDLSAATNNAYALLLESIKSSEIKADIRNQTAIAV